MELNKKKLSALKKEFESVKITAVKLSSKFGISRSKLYSLVKEHGWKKYTKPIDRPSRGRPSKYRDEFCEQAKSLCMLGFTNEKLAEFFGVNIDTIYDWKTTKPKFSEALLEGRVKPCAETAASLFKRAIGYEHEEEKIFYESTRGLDGEVEEVVASRTVTTKHYPPEVKAIALILKNKFPDLWKEKQEVGLNHGVKEDDSFTIEFIKTADQVKK